MKRPSPEDVLERIVRSHSGQDDLCLGLLGLMAKQRGLPVPRGTASPARGLASQLGDCLDPSLLLPPRLLGELFEREVAARGEEGRRQRKYTGSYYTPAVVVRHIVARTVAPSVRARLSRLRTGRGSILGAVLDCLRGYRVCDPSMGAGFFLLEALETMTALAVARISREGVQPDEETIRSIKRVVAIECLHGMDIDPGARRLARDAIWIGVGDPGLDRRTLDAHLHLGDGLRVGVLDGVGFHAVVGNPPYGAQRPAHRRERRDSGSVATPRGYSNTALMFLLRSHQLLCGAGRLGLILPKSLAYSQGWRPGVQLILPGLMDVLDASLAFEDVRLEQIIVIASRGRARSSFYRTGRLLSGRAVVTGKVSRAISRSASCLLVDTSSEEIEVFAGVQHSCLRLGDVTTSFRGIGLQGGEVRRGGMLAVDGRSVQRWHLEGTLRRFGVGDVPRARIRRLQATPKILSQNIVAHIKRPSPHIRLTSCLDLDGLITLDTVTNTVTTDPLLDPFLVLALMNSRFLSWWAYRFIFSGAVRTMHLDAAYIGRLPFPRPDHRPDRQREASSLARRIVRAGPSADSGSLIQRLEALVDEIFGVQWVGSGYVLDPALR